MVNLYLGMDEYVIHESDNVSWNSREDLNLTNLVLTNKKIYCICEKNNGIFRKSTIEQFVLSLSDIKVINEQALVQQVKYEGCWCLQIQFIQGIEYFEFYDSPKKEIPKWIISINNALGLVFDSSNISSKSVKKSRIFGNIFTDVTSSLKTVVDTASENFGFSQKQSEKEIFTIINHSNNIDKNILEEEKQTNSKQEEKSVFCVNCGSQLSQGIRFCPYCGHRVRTLEDISALKEDIDGVNEMVGSTQSVEENKKQKNNQENVNSERQQEYVGKIYKCPHCGNVVNQSDTVCSSCGSHLSGKEAINSVMDFQQQLFKIEMNRKDKKIGFWDQREALDTTDKQMIALIKSYPIPNTIEDIVEFFHLAIGNIDISKSKKSVFNSDSWDGGSREREISNAWVGKLQQIYKKAELYFPNEIEFSHIKEAYQTIMKELKIL